MQVRPGPGQSLRDLRQKARESRTRTRRTRLNKILRLNSSPGSASNPVPNSRLVTCALGFSVLICKMRA